MKGVNNPMPIFTAYQKLAAVLMKTSEIYNRRLN